MKGSLCGKVISPPKETKSCVRFMMEFRPHEETEITITGSARDEARKVKIGDRVAIEKCASIGYLQFSARSVTRLVSVPV